MKILNFGSVNIDHVYAVDHFVRPGETLAGTAYAQHPGGKGFNQSVALARAGAAASHAGRIGRDGLWLKDYLGQCGADTAYLAVGDGPTGHAIIQVTPQGENAIVLFGGANRQVTRADAAAVLAHFGRSDYLLLQNEISATAEIMALAAEGGLTVVFNPAPMHPEIMGYPLDKVSLFILNEVEGADLTGETAPDLILRRLRERYPQAAAVLTLGAEGARYADARETAAAPALRVKAVDTTAAGDTFIGYFLAERMAGHAPRAALQTACKAAALCVLKPGAADSIPTRAEVTRWQPA